MGCPSGFSLRNVALNLCAIGLNASVFLVTSGLNTLFTDWQMSFQTSRAATASVQAVCLGVTAGAGLLVALVERKFGQRKTLLAGSLLSATGIFAGSFAGSLPELLFCVGILTGFGFAVLLLCCMSCMMLRFPGKSAFVSSIMGLSSGLSMFCSPFVYRFFTETYSWRGSLMMAAALNSHAAVFSLFLTSPLHKTHKSLSSDASRPPSGGPQHPPLQTPPHTFHPPRSVPDCLSEQCGKQSASPLNGDAEKSGSYDSDPSAELALLDEEFRHNRTSSDRDFPSETALVGETAVMNRSGNDFDLVHEPVCSGDAPIVFDVLLSKSTDGGQAVDGCADATKSPNSRAFITQRVNSHPESSDDNILSVTDADILIEQEASLRDTMLSKNTGEASSHSDFGRSPPKEANRGRTHKWLQHAGFLTNPLYAAVVLSSILNIGISSGFIFLVLDYASYHGWGMEGGLFINLLYMVTNLTGRVVVLLLSILPKFNSIVCLGVAGLIGGLAAFLIGQTSDRVVAACGYVCLALCNGWSMNMIPASVMQAVQGKDLIVALGLCLSLVGASIIACTTVAGSLVDWQGSYSLVSIVYGVMMLSASVLMLLILKFRRNPGSLSVN